MPPSMSSRKNARWLPNCLLNIVLVEPEIPPNTGNIARLCLAAGARLHLVEPLGFSIDDKALRRAGMDYWHECDIRTWKSYAAFAEANPQRRAFYLTTKTTQPYWDAKFADEDFLILSTFVRSARVPCRARQDSLREELKNA